MIHIIIILLLKIVYDIVPSVTQETSWTLVNITYMFGSYLMFHWVRGIPFEFNAGAYDNLNMWEQMDNEDQYTPAKKFLLAVPICLFLVSTHYTHYSLAYFMVNFLATLAVVVPKLPAVRFDILATCKLGLTHIPATSHATRLPQSGTRTDGSMKHDSEWLNLAWRLGRMKWDTKTDFYTTADTHQTCTFTHHF